MLRRRRPIEQTLVETPQSDLLPSDLGEWPSGRTALPAIAPMPDAGLRRKGRPCRSLELPGARIRLYAAPLLLAGAALGPTLQAFLSAVPGAI
ncbi:hypothetical protein [Roseibium aestuarii]|uniref:Uncharacterized protein n=1 Tax=Roseibium aestuarii TaxID=2600299 RepID=A0ABW4JWL0_9HYPH|nr:hypothetical protein [Roseibium aestuarii]